MLGRGLNLPGGAVKDVPGHGWLEGAPCQDKLAVKSTLEMGKIQA